MRIPATIVAVIVFFTIAACALAAGQRDLDDCNARELDRKIAGCAAIIQDQDETTANRAIAYNNRGAAYGTRREYDLAIADYDRAIDLNPRYTNAYYNRGLAHRAKGDLDRAIADYGSAIGLDPNARIYTGRGNVYQDRGDFDRAIADYDDAIALEPGFVIAHNNRGNAMLRKGDLDRAIADYDEALRLAPQFAVAYSNRGNAHRAKGDLDRAISDYDEAIKLNPRYLNPHFNRGVAYLYSGFLAKAEADLRRANEIDPKYPFATLWLHLAEGRGNRPSHLEQDAEQLDLKAWPAPLVHLFLGELTPPQALVVADDKNPMTKQGRVCEVHFYSGELALLQNAKDEALRLFRTAARDCPYGYLERDGASAELKALGAGP